MTGFLKNFIHMKENNFCVKLIKILGNICENFGEIEIILRYFLENLDGILENNNSGKIWQNIWQNFNIFLRKFCQRKLRKIILIIFFVKLMQILGNICGNFLEMKAKF